MRRACQLPQVAEQRAGAPRIQPRRTAEVLIQRKQRVGFQLPEHASQALLDSIHRVKEVSSIHPQLAGTQLPVRSQQKMIAEQAVLGLRQSSSGDQTKIRDILLVFPAPSGRPVSS